MHRENINYPLYAIETLPLYIIFSQVHQINAEATEETKDPTWTYSVPYSQILLRDINLY